MKRFPHLPAAHAAVQEQEEEEQEGEETDSWLSSALSAPRRETDSLPRRELDSFPRRDFEETESAPSSVPVSPSVTPRRNLSFVVTPRTRPEAAQADDEEPRGRAQSAAAAETSTKASYVGERGRLPDTWQEVVEAAAREVASEEEEVRVTRCSSMPDVPSHAGDGRQQRRPIRRVSSVGREDTGGRGRDGGKALAAELTVGSAYDELFAKRGKSPRAVRPTEAKVCFSW